MATLTVWKYDTEGGADAALSKLIELQKQELITVIDAAVVCMSVPPVLRAALEHRMPCKVVHAIVNCRQFRPSSTVRVLAVQDARRTLVPSSLHVNTGEFAKLLHIVQVLLQAQR